MSLIQSTDKSVLLKNQNFLYNKYVRLYNEVCLLKGLLEDGEGEGGIGVESDPIFTASPAFGITNANITQWNNGTGNVDLSNYVDRTTAQSIAGTKTFTISPLFTDTYANGQASFGQTNQAARVIFNNGVNGAASLIVGYTAATGAIPEIRSTATAGLSFTTTNVSAPMWFTTGGSESMRILANGSLLIGQTVDNAGGKLQVTGNSTFSGDIMPDGNTTRNVGSSSVRFNALYSAASWSLNFVNNGQVSFGTTNASSQILIRQGTAAQTIGGAYGTTGNWTFQAPGSTLGTDSGERLQVEGTTKLAGVVTVAGNILSATDNTYNIGAANNRFSTGYIGNIVSPGTLTLNGGSAAFGIQFRQSASNLIIGGFYPTSGNYYLQAPGAITSDTGQRLQVAGTTLLGGDVLLGGNIAPDGNGTRDNGSATSRWLNVFTTRISTGGIAQTLTFNADGTTSTTYMGSYPTTRNVFIQPAGALTPDTGERLQVEGSARFAGAVGITSNLTLTGGNVQTSADNSGSVGTSGARFSTMFSTQFLGASGQVIFGNASANQAILFRQGSVSQLPFGIFTTGRTFVQTPGALPTDTGEQLQVTGTSRFTGDQTVTGNQIITGNLTVSGTLGLTSLSLSGTLGVSGVTTLGGSLLLRAGTATAGTAPMKFTSGPLLTTSEVGAMEFLSDDFYGTISTGPARKKFVLAEPAAGLTTGRIPYSTTNGRLTDLASLLFSSTRGGLLSVGTTSATANLNVGATATATGNFPLAIFTGAAHTAQTASTELNDIYFNLARTVTFATGNLATQRAIRITAPTYSTPAASTFTTAATLSIGGAPGQSGAIVITNPLAFWVEAGASRFDGNVQLNSIPALGSAATTVLTSNGGVISSRTVSQFLSDVGASNNTAYTASGTGALTQITIPHGLGRTPVAPVVSAGNAASAGITFITADGTNFYVNFSVAPVSGTNNLLFNISYK